MAERARLHDISILMEARSAVAAFADEVRRALGAVDADVQRVSQWLSLERPAYWKAEVRRREDAVNQARAAIAKKQISRAPEPASVVEERQELQRQQRRLEEARQRQEAVKRWAPIWDKEAQMYKSSCASVTEWLGRDAPAAMARLDAMMKALDAYLAVRHEDGEARADRAETAGTIPLGGARWATLRAHDPAPQERDATPLRPMIGTPWSAGTLHPDDAEALGRLAASGELPPAGDRVVIGWRAIDQHEVYFSRRRGDAGDSGWFIGPADRPEVTNGLRAASVADVLSWRPDWASLLRLEPGTLVVVLRGRVRAVIDAEGRDMWETPA